MTAELHEKPIDLGDGEYRIGRLTLGPDDILVVKVSAEITQETACRIRDWAKQAVGEDRKVMVLDPNCDLAVLTPA